MSADEIAARLQTLHDSKVGLMSSAVQVTLNGKPLAKATVTLIPEAFLGSAFKRATAVSDTGGNVMLQTEGAKIEGVAPGLYRVEISLLDSSGRETLLTKYNTKTTLGCEIAPDLKGALEFKLSSR